MYIVRKSFKGAELERFRKKEKAEEVALYYKNGAFPNAYVDDSEEE